MPTEPTEPTEREFASTVHSTGASSLAFDPTRFRAGSARARIHHELEFALTERRIDSVAAIGSVGSGTPLLNIKTNF